MSNIYPESICAVNIQPNTEGKEEKNWIKKSKWEKKEKKTLVDSLTKDLKTETPTHILCFWLPLPAGTGSVTDCITWARAP